MNDADMQILYHLHRSISIDRAVSEKTRDLLVAQIDTKWQDLGCLQNIRSLINSFERPRFSRSNSDLLKVFDSIASLRDLNYGDEHKAKTIGAIR